MNKKRNRTIQKVIKKQICHFLSGVDHRVNCGLTVVYLSAVINRHLLFFFFFTSNLMQFLLVHLHGYHRHDTSGVIWCN